MAITNQAMRFTQQGRPGANGPAVVFATAMLTAFAALALAALTLPKDFALASVASLLFAFAAIVSLLAWRLCQPDKGTLTYWDVAGALTLIGICAATLMDSDQLLRLVEDPRAGS